METCNGEEFEYTYDAVGNRLSQIINEFALSYTYGDTNQLMTVTGQTSTWNGKGNPFGYGTST